MGDAWRLGHRPALDGLRGVAILLVLASHSTTGQLAAFGSAGVTVFFVLSGFLITALLLEEQGATGRVGVGRFYLRRARRLLPALGVSMAVFVVLGWVTVGSVYVWPSAAVATLYVGNWVLAFGGDLGAFDTTWSLAVEEQFYLVWPLLVILSGRRSRVVVIAVVLGCTSAATRFGLLLGGASMERIYAGTDTVAFALLVGAVLAALRLRGDTGPTSTSTFGFGAGLLVIVAMCFAGGLYGFVIGGFLVVALAAGWMVWAATGTGPVRPLESRWLGWFGSRSYGLYLWHGPLLWAMRDHYGLSWPWLVLIGLPLSVAAAELSFRYVEAPFRARRDAPRPAPADAADVALDRA